jgi:hypothetical protein
MCWISPEKEIRPNINIMIKTIVKDLFSEGQKKKKKKPELQFSLES